MRHTFRIAYKVYDATGVMVKPGSMRCKGKPSEEVAKRELETYLMRTVPGARRVVFIQCVNETKEKEDAGVLALASKLTANRKSKPATEAKRARTQKDIHDELVPKD